MYRVSNKSITRSRGVEGGGGGGCHTNERTRTHTRVPPIHTGRLHEGSLRCASISVMIFPSREGICEKGDRTFPRLSSVSPKCPLSKVVLPDASRAVSIFVFATSCETNAPRVWKFLFSYLTIHSYCLKG